MFERLILKEKRDKGNLLVFVASSIFVVLFLFFIDEGNYNFSWAQNIFSYIVLLIYVIPMILLQWFIYQLFPKGMSKTTKYTVSVSAGILSGLLLVIGGFYLLV